MVSPTLELGLDDIVPERSGLGGLIWVVLFGVMRNRPSPSCGGSPDAVVDDGLDGEEGRGIWVMLIDGLGGC